jgi:ABC-type ATPase involved in cell division
VRLLVDGEDMSLMGAIETQANHRHLRFVSQDFKLVECTTVFENTAFMPRVMCAGPTVQRRLSCLVLGGVVVGGDRR